MGRNVATEADAARVEDPRGKGRKWVVIIGVAVFGVMIALLAASLPDGATYEEYEQLKPGMSRKQVEAVIGQGDYWHHKEGDRDVTSWVNKDGTYIRTVFDKDDVLVEASWKTGWDPAWQKEE